MEIVMGFGNIWELIMRAKILLVMSVVFLFATCSVQAYPDKTFDSSGEINDGDAWNDVNICGNSTVVNMFGGWVASVTTYDESTFNVYDGSIDRWLSDMF